MNKINVIGHRKYEAVLIMDLKTHFYIGCADFIKKSMGTRHTPYKIFYTAYVILLILMR